MKKFLSIVVLVLASLTVMGQERMVEVHVDTPIRKNVTTDNLTLGGKVYLPAFDGRMFIEADLDYNRAYQLFLTPSDAIQVSGKAWVFLTPKTPDGSKVRPFVLGGMTQTQALSTLPSAVDGSATQFNTGFGLLYERGNGFAFAPSLEFNTNELGNGGTGIGKEFESKFRFFVPTGKSFRLVLTPYVSRQEDVIQNLYYRKYGVTIGFGRVF